MTPRKKYTILGVVGGLGRLLAIASWAFVAHIKNYGIQVAIFDEMPSNESLTRLEAQGITREQVLQLTKDMPLRLQPQQLNTWYLTTCDKQIKDGNITKAQFDSCVNFLHRYYRNQLTFLLDMKNVTKNLGFGSQFEEEGRRWFGIN